MNKVLQKYTDGLTFTNAIGIDSYSLLKHHNQEETAEHSLKVANEAVKLAYRFGVRLEAAEISGLLHDIGKIVHETDMVIIAYELNIEVLEEEKAYPDLLHAKLSAVMAEQIFNIKNSSVLSAIECHSTLKPNPSKLDLVLFLADKISWEREYNQDFISDVLKGLDKSLEHGAFAYIKYLNSKRQNLKAVHPWLKDAYHYLMPICQHY